MDGVQGYDKDQIALALVSAHMAYRLVVQQAMATIEDGKTGESGPNDYDKIVTTKEAETIDAPLLLSYIHKDEDSSLGEGTNVMTQALHVEDGSLPQGLTVQNTYTELCNGSKIIAVVARNSTTYPQMLRKKIPVARAVAVTWIPELPMQISLTEV